MKKPLPKKWFANLYTSSYLICQLIFFITTLGNMPVFIDTIDLSGHEHFAILFNQYYIYFCIVAGTYEFLLCAFTTYIFADRKWPTLLTMITMSVNMLICNASSVGLYLLDLRNVYFTFQATFAIPIISIFLSSVFLIDDTMDLYSGRFELHRSSITKKAQGVMRERAEDLFGGTAFDITENAFVKRIDERNEIKMREAHEASRAAALEAIPYVNRNDLAVENQEIVDSVRETFKDEIEQKITE